jgi:hypothetical protein
MNKLLKTAVLTVATFFTAASTYAVVVIHEDFTYPNGGLVGNDGWANLSGTGSFIQVSGGVVTGLLAQTASSEDAGLTFTGTTAPLFYAFDLQYTGATPAGNAYFAALRNSGSFVARTFLAAPTTSGFRLGIGTNATGDGAATIFTPDLTNNTLYRVVVGYNPTTGALNFWINNGVEGSPDLSIAAAGTTATLNGFNLRQGGNAANNYSGLNIDNFEIATTFDEAFNFAPIPEPSTYAMMLVGAGLLFGMQRLRRKTS